MVEANKKCSQQGQAKAARPNITSQMSTGYPYCSTKDIDIKGLSSFHQQKRRPKVEDSQEIHAVSMSHRKRVPDSSQFPTCSSAAHQCGTIKEKRNEHELVKNAELFSLPSFTPANDNICKGAGNLVNNK